MDKQALIEDARAMIGTPYRHEGRSETGVDCYGFFLVLAEKHGISAPVEKGYGMRPSGRHMRLKLEEYCEPINAVDLAPGDILHIKYRSEPQHLALVSSLDPTRIIHADTLAGKVVEQRLDAQHLNCVRGAYRIRTDG